MFNNGDPLNEIAEKMGTTEHGVIGKLNNEHAENPDKWDLSRLKHYRSVFYQHNKALLKKRCMISRLQTEMRESVRFIGYQMGSISREVGRVKVEIENDMKPPNRIYGRDLGRDFGQHAKEALAYKAFQDLSKDVDISLEDDSIVIISFDRRGIDDSTIGKMDKFLDVYCSILGYEKKMESKLRQQPIPQYRFRKRASASVF